jgi:predicted ATPase
MEEPMLKRVYADNYKSLTNFELSVGPINLFLGPNGAGKSAVFDTLRKLVDFVGGRGKIAEVFDFRDRTRWQNSLTQAFELEIERKIGIYKYELAVEHDVKGDKARVKYERLWFNGKPLLRFEINAAGESEVHLYRDDHSAGPIYPFDWSQSALASILPRNDNTLLTWFKQHLQRFVILQIVPCLMSAESSQEETRPSVHLENYASWYRSLSQDQGLIYQLTNELREVLPGFDHFRFEMLGEQNRLLKVRFQGKTGDSPSEYRLSDLSDGQRTLIALYTILVASTAGGENTYTLCLDEPENFLALPEIQP